MRQHRFDETQLAFLDLERLCNLPGPQETLGLRGLALPGDWRRRAAVMIEEGKRHHRAMNGIDDKEAPVTNARDHVVHPGGELSFAAHGADRLHRRRGTTGRQLHIGRLCAVLEPVAIIRERIVTLAVILLQASEVFVRGLDQILARHALRFRNHLTPERIGLAELFQIGSRR